MLRLYFEGWFQCRLATDPDPPDEPRGVSGWTFAVAGEPNLDRIIRLQPNGTVPRFGGPTIGVAVTKVERDGIVDPQHPLLAAAVHLGPTALFDGRNHIEADDGYEPIRPFELKIEKNGLCVGRSHVEKGIPGSPNGLGDQMGPLPTDRAQRLGIADPRAVRAARKALLEKRYQSTGLSETEKAALGKRISELSRNGERDIQVILFRRALPYRFAVNGAVATSGDMGALGANLNDPAPWPIEFFMGAWDADALCGYMMGHWDVGLNQ